MEKGRGALDQQSVMSLAFLAGPSSVWPWARPPLSKVLLPEKCRNKLNHCFPRSTRQFGEVHGWMFKNILSKPKFYNDFKIWSKKNIEGSLTHFTNIRNQGNKLFPVHIFKFCHQSRSPYKSKPEAVSLFTTSHSVKVYTKWNQARPSERQQVIHTLCLGYSESHCWLS